MPEPNGQDAILYIQLLNSSQGETQTEARRWVFGDFKAKDYEELNSSYPVGSPERGRLRNVMAFFESVGVLVSRGLLNEDLFFDAPLGFEFLWPLVKPVLAGWRTEGGDAAAWENLEWLGLRFEFWRKETWKPKLEVFPPDESPEKKEPTVRGFQH